MHEYSHTDIDLSAIHNYYISQKRNRTKHIFLAFKDNMYVPDYQPCTCLVNTYLPCCLTNHTLHYTK